MRIRQTLPQVIITRGSCQGPLRFQVDWHAPGDPIRSPRHGTGNGLNISGWAEKADEPSVLLTRQDPRADLAGVVDRSNVAAAQVDLKRVGSDSIFFVRLGCQAAPRPPLSGCLRRPRGFGWSGGPDDHHDD